MKKGHFVCQSSYEILCRWPLLYRNEKQMLVSHSNTDQQHPYSLPAHFLSDGSAWAEFGRSAAELSLRLALMRSWQCGQLGPYVT